MDARLPELLQIVTAIGKKGNFVSFFRPTGTTAPGSIRRESRQQSPHPSPRPRASMPTNDHRLLRSRGFQTTAASTRILFARSQALSSRITPAKAPLHFVRETRHYNQARAGEVSETQPANASVGMG